MIAVTGASGQLGTLVIDALLKKLPAEEIIGVIRNPGKAAALASKGIVLREADYDRPETLVPAFEGVEKLLLISSSEVGKRVKQHKAVIDAAGRADVKLLAYTSILHANYSTLGLADEHRLTETAIRESGLSYVLLRNSWYTENYAAAIPTALEHGVVMGCAGEGLIASAPRRDYAAAAAAVLTSATDQSGRIYELAGDEAYTLAQFAAEISRQSGKSVIYQNMSQADYTAALVGVGFPEPFAALLADSDTGVSKGGLFDDSHQLSALIGRPTTPLSEVVAEALRALG